MTIEGIPEGWELVGVRPVYPGEFRLMDNGTVKQWTHSLPSAVWAVILRKIEKPKQYRPFANAEEAESLWDRKLRSKNEKGWVYRIFGLTNTVVLLGHGTYTYKDAFEIFECDDGTPFGVEVTE